MLFAAYGSSQTPAAINHPHLAGNEAGSRKGQAFYAGDRFE
jgi:hypothetical protein